MEVASTTTAALDSTDVQENTRGIVDNDNAIETIEKTTENPNSNKEQEETVPRKSSTSATEALKSQHQSIENIKTSATEADAAPTTSIVQDRSRDFGELLVEAEQRTLDEGTSAGVTKSLASMAGNNKSLASLRHINAPTTEEISEQQQAAVDSNNVDPGPRISSTSLSTIKQHQQTNDNTVQLRNSQTSIRQNPNISAVPVVTGSRESIAKSHKSLLSVVPENKELATTEAAAVVQEPSSLQQDFGSRRSLAAKSQKDLDDNQSERKVQRSSEALVENTKESLSKRASRNEIPLANSRARDFTSSEETAPVPKKKSEDIRSSMQSVRSKLSLERKSTNSLRSNATLSTNKAVSKQFISSTKDISRTGGKSISSGKPKKTSKETLSSDDERQNKPTPFKNKNPLKSRRDKVDISVPDISKKSTEASKKSSSSLRKQEEVQVTQEYIHKGNYKLKRESFHGARTITNDEQVSSEELPGRVDPVENHQTKKTITPKDLRGNGDLRQTKIIKRKDRHPAQFLDEQINYPLSRTNSNDTVILSSDQKGVSDTEEESRLQNARENLLSRELFKGKSGVKQSHRREAKVPHVVVSSKLKKDSDGKTYEVEIDDAPSSRRSKQVMQQLQSSTYEVFGYGGPPVNSTEYAATYINRTTATQNANLYPSGPSQQQQQPANFLQNNPQVLLPSTVFQNGHVGNVRNRPAPTNPPSNISIALEPGKSGYQYVDPHTGRSFVINLYNEPPSSDTIIQQQQLPQQQGVPPSRHPIISAESQAQNIYQQASSGQILGTATQSMTKIPNTSNISGVSMQPSVDIIPDNSGVQNNVEASRNTNIQGQQNLSTAALLPQQQGKTNSSISSQNLNTNSSNFALNVAHSVHGINNGATVSKQQSMVSNYGVVSMHPSMADVVGQTEQETIATGGTFQQQSTPILASKVQSVASNVGQGVQQVLVPSQEIPVESSYAPLSSAQSRAEEATAPTIHYSKHNIATQQSFGSVVTERVSREQTLGQPPAMLSKQGSSVKFSEPPVENQPPPQAVGVSSVGTPHQMSLMDQATSTTTLPSVVHFERPIENKATSTTALLSRNPSILKSSKQNSKANVLGGVEKRQQSFAENETRRAQANFEAGLKKIGQDIKRARDVKTKLETDNAELRARIRVLKQKISTHDATYFPLGSPASAFPPAATSKVPTSVQANLNLKYQFKKRIDIERAKYDCLQEENRNLFQRLKNLQQQLNRKAVSIEQETHRRNEILYWKNKYKEIEKENYKNKELLNVKVKQLEREGYFNHKLKKKIDAISTHYSHIPPSTVKDHLILDSINHNSDNDIPTTTHKRRHHRSKTQPFANNVSKYHSAKLSSRGDGYKNIKSLGRDDYLRLGKLDRELTLSEEEEDDYFHIPKRYLADESAGLPENGDGQDKQNLTKSQKSLDKLAEESLKVAGDRKSENVNDIMERLTKEAKMLLDSDDAAEEESSPQYTKKASNRRNVQGDDEDEDEKLRLAKVQVEYDVWVNGGATTNATTTAGKT